MSAKESRIQYTTVLSPDTSLGQVHLTISDMERSLAFYQVSLGFNLLRREEDTAALGVGGKEIVILTERPGAVKFPRRSGLYHFAVLVPSRQELALILKNLVDTGANLSGGADHLVSEALYLDDPDGNGIEIYRDRPRSKWQTNDGGLVMGTEPLDYGGLLAELNDGIAWQGLPTGTILGHMHLHVAHLEEASSFYQELIGLDLMLGWQGNAAFLSAGGYHHHLGLNVWNGVGAPPPPENSIGLRYFTLHLSDDREQKKLIQKLKDAAWPFGYDESGVFVEDPSKNKILFTGGE